MRNAVVAATVLTLALLPLVGGCGGDKPADSRTSPASGPEAGATQAPGAGGAYSHALATAACCLAAAASAGLCGLALAKVGAGCVESMARQPEASGSIFTSMVVVAAMIEGGMLFAIVVCMWGVIAAK